MATVQYIIKRPIVTEKSTRLRETGGHPRNNIPEQYQKKIQFEVASRANKIEIKKAIERLFQVKVVDVHTQIVRGKHKKIGRFTGRRPNWKKAIVTLQTGNTIEIFEGM